MSMKKKKKMKIFFYLVKKVEGGDYNYNARLLKSKGSI